MWALGPRFLLKGGIVRAIQSLGTYETWASNYVPRGLRFLEGIAGGCGATSVWEGGN